MIKYFVKISRRDAKAGMKHLKKTAMVIYFLLFISALAACGSSTPTPAGTNAENAVPATVDLTPETEAATSFQSSPEPAERSDSGESYYGSLTSFSADTVFGNVFTQDDLAGYDLTMINIWATTCRYCIKEMPALEILYRQLPENVNLISICVDVVYDEELTRSILDDGGVTFETLLRNDSLDEIMLNKISVTPTTLFVDKEGHVVGSAVLGAPAAEDMDEAALFYMEEIKAHLLQLESV